jgi:hypothetical protein
MELLNKLAATVGLGQSIPKDEKLESHKAKLQRLVRVLPCAAALCCSAGSGARGLAREPSSGPRRAQTDATRRLLFMIETLQKSFSKYAEANVGGWTARCGAARRETAQPAHATQSSCASECKSRETSASSIASRRRAQSLPPTLQTRRPPCRRLPTWCARRCACV